MSIQNKVSYQNNADNLFSNDSFIRNNESFFINEVYNDAIMSIIYENNHLINDNIVLPSETEINTLEAKLDGFSMSSINKNDNKYKKIRSFIEKYSSN